MGAKRLLSDEQWAKVEPLLPKLASKGRPWADNRAVLEGILWVLKTGARWRDMPPDYPSGPTCWRRLRKWEEEDVWLDIWRSFLSELDQQGKLDWSETFMDGSFAPAKKRGACVGKTKRGKGTKWMVVVDGKGVPQGSQLASASPAEVKLGEDCPPEGAAQVQPRGQGALRAPAGIPARQVHVRVPRQRQGLPRLRGRVRFVPSLPRRAEAAVPGRRPSPGSARAQPSSSQ